MTKDYFEYLNNLAKEDLIDLIYKKLQPKATCSGKSKRKIALRISYDGKNYSGVQSHENKLSISECIENALQITNLGDTLVFCGRTDAGVSAINMVVSLDANSRLDDPNKDYSLAESDYDEFPYDVILNTVLPDDIRITGWAPVPDDFSARYSCIQRQYKYFFILEDLNLDLMRYAADEISKLDNFYSLSTHSNPKAKYDRRLDCIQIYKINSNGTDQDNYCDDASGLDSRNIHQLNINTNQTCVISKNRSDLRESRLLDINGNDKNWKRNENHLNKNMKNLKINTNQTKSNFYHTSSVPITEIDPYLEKISKINSNDQHEIQNARTRQLRINHNQKLKEKREIDNDIYCLDIKASGFLHNMVRKIFWAIRNCGKGNKLNLKKVELADPEPLVFVGCKFKTKLNFIGNKYSEKHFKSEANKSRIHSVISSLRYQSFDNLID
jgi:tRNA pseudouridine(38-40) synthase